VPRHQRSVAATPRRTHRGGRAHGSRALLPRVSVGYQQRLPHHTCLRRIRLAEL